MPLLLERRYGNHELHFITFSCYERLPLLDSPEARSSLVEVLGEVRAEFGVLLLGYVVMPEHVHLLISESPNGTPSQFLQVLKQRVSRALRARKCASATPLLQAGVLPLELPHFWQRRFHDFNVWSKKKRGEKIHYMHLNPVKRSLVEDPGQWPWSSYSFYFKRGVVLLGIDVIE